MSVVVAIRENGVVYMGADTQVSSQMQKRNELNEICYKMHITETGLLVGVCGRVVSEQLLRLNEVYTLNDQGVLTKEHIIRKIIPDIKDVFGKAGGLDQSGKCMNLTILLAHKDVLYQIEHDFSVFAVGTYAAIGAGEDFAIYSLFCRSKPIRERMLEALSESAKWIASVGKPFILADTNQLCIEVVKDDSCN